LHLIITHGPGRGTRLVLGSETVRLGRDPSNDLIIDDTRASRQHAEIVLANPETWLLRDGGSRNGTLVNGEPISRTILEAGDVITIGECTIAVHAVQEHMSTFSVKIDPASLQRKLQGEIAADGISKSLQEALFEMGLLNRAQHHPEKLVQQVIQIIRSGVHFESWGWIRWNEDGSRKANGERDGVSASLEEIDPSMTLVEASRRRREGLISSEVGNAFEASVCVRRKQALSAIALPLIGRDNEISVLYLERGSGTRPFTEAELNWVASLGVHLTVDLENSRLFSDLKEAHEELLESREQLTRQEKMVAIGRLASGFAHDLNNPLGSVIGFLQLANRDLKSDSGDPEKSKVMVQKALDAADFCRALCRNLLAFARTRPFKPGSDRPFNVHEVVKGTLDICEARLRDSRVETDVNIPADLHLAGDSTALRQVIMNLALNSSDAMTDSGLGGKISIHGKSLAAGGIELIFEDDGPGMTESIANLAFDPLYSTKETDKGSGLGLYVVQRIIDGAGGCIDLETSPGKGARFKIVLPDSMAQLGSEEINPLDVSTHWQEESQ